LCCWEDLQTTKITNANDVLLLANKRTPKNFFVAMHFLKATLPHGARTTKKMWKRSKNNLRRKHGWCYMECIAALKAAKTKWPANNFGTVQLEMGGGFGHRRVVLAKFHS
jgi:hypothetical protein